MKISKTKKKVEFSTKGLTPPPLVEKMNYKSWNGFCMIWVDEQLPDDLTRDVRSYRWSLMMK